MFFSLSSSKMLPNDFFHGIKEYSDCPVAFDNPEGTSNVQAHSPAAPLLECHYPRTRTRGLRPSRHGAARVSGFQAEAFLLPPDQQALAKSLLSGHTARSTLPFFWQCRSGYFFRLSVFRRFDVQDSGDIRPSMQRVTQSQLCRLRLVRHDDQK